MENKNLKKELKNKIKGLRALEKANKDAYILGLIAAINLKDSIGKTVFIDKLRDLVRTNLEANGHRDKVEEVLYYITEERIKDAVPMLAYRCFDFFPKREKEIEKIYEEKEAKQKTPKKRVVIKIKKKH